MTDDQDDRSFLGSYLGAFLHQDWPDMHDNVWDALSELRSGPRESTERTARLLEDLLRSCPDEASLNHEMDRWEIHYRPEIHGLTYRGWIAQVVTFLRDRTVRLNRN